MAFAFTKRYYTVKEQCAFMEKLNKRQGIYSTGFK